MAYTRQEISDGDVERKIITGIIVDDHFCRDCVPIIKMKYFKADYTKQIAQWVFDYYKKYKKAPRKDILSIFQAESAKMKDAEALIIEKFLEDISSQYEEDQSFNKEYLFDQAVKFCDKRSLEILRDQIDGYVIQGKIDKAASEVRSFNKVAKETSRWVNPFDKDEIAKTLEDDQEDNLFKLPGALGEMIGYLKRAWLIAIMGPMKRGKSFYAWEFAYWALTWKLKVAVFSLEMNETQYKKRIYKRMTAMAEHEGDYPYPIFDCYFNQIGECTKSERKNRIKLYGEDEDPPEYSKDMRYRACDHCRNHQGLRKDYRPAFWWSTQIQKEGLSTEAIAKKVKMFKRLYGENLRLKCYPAFSASFDDILADLDNLEYTEEFIPDVVLVDYFDITSTEYSDERAEANRKWQRGKNLAAVKQVLVINCNQSNRDSIDKVNLSQKHTAEDIRKLAHIDALFVLNQTVQEKEKGVMRMETLIHRHDEAAEKGQVFVLQQLALGQPFLDSEWEKNNTKRR
jgi:replicative DNA helicase